MQKSEGYGIVRRGAQFLTRIHAGVGWYKGIIKRSGLYNMGS